MCGTMDAWLEVGGMEGYLEKKREEVKAEREKEAKTRKAKSS
jgi:hypothetical protein